MRSTQQTFVDTRIGDLTMRIVVQGYVIRCPLGAMVWHYLQFVLGLKDLGHEVVFLEDSGDDRLGSYDPEQDAMVDFPDRGLKWTAELFERVGLEASWAYYRSSVGCVVWTDGQSHEIVLQHR